MLGWAPLAMPSVIAPAPPCLLVVCHLAVDKVACGRWSALALQQPAAVAGQVVMHLHVWDGPRWPAETQVGATHISAMSRLLERPSVSAPKRYKDHMCYRELS